MSLLLNRALANARLQMRTLMTDVCEIQTLTTTSDGAGGESDPDWQTTETVACKVSSVTARNTMIADRLSEAVDVEIKLPAETAITSDQRIRYPGPPEVIYAIVGVNAPRTLELTRTLFAQTVR